MMFGKIVATLGGGALLEEAHQRGTGFEVLKASLFPCSLCFQTINARQ